MESQYEPQAAFVRLTWGFQPTGTRLGALAHLRPCVWDDTGRNKKNQGKKNKVRCKMKLSWLSTRFSVCNLWK